MTGGISREMAKKAVCLSNVHQLAQACVMYTGEWKYLPTNWNVTNPSAYPGCVVQLGFFGVTTWAYTSQARADLSQTWPYHHSEKISYCPDWAADPELVAAVNLWPGLGGSLSYGFNTLTLHRFRTTTGGWADVYGNSAVLPEQFADPGQTLWFMDSRSGYSGAYCCPPTWELIYQTWPMPVDPAQWWETFCPSQRHLGDFNAGFLDGHAEICDFEEFYMVGPDSRSAKHWGLYK